MKKVVLPLLMLSLTSATLSAQETTTETTTIETASKDYNKWSIELNGGVNKYQRPATGGYYTAT